MNRHWMALCTRVQPGSRPSEAQGWGKAAPEAGETLNLGFLRNLRASVQGDTITSSIFNNQCKISTP